MNEKDFLEKLRTYLKKSVKLSVDQDGEFFRIDTKTTKLFYINIEGLETNCASKELYNFSFLDQYFQYPDKALKLIIDYIISDLDYPFVLFSDSGRNDVIYNYLSEFEADSKYIVLTNRTNDGESLIKTVIYSEQK